MRRWDRAGRHHGPFAQDLGITGRNREGWLVFAEWMEGLWGLEGVSSHGVLVREVQEASGPPMALLPHRLPPGWEPPGPEAEAWADADDEGALLFRSFCRRWILVWRFLSSLLANLRPQ